jgi:Ca2+-binding EF-hand superfamily protein
MRDLVQRFDRNGDGVVSPDEMPPGMARRLQRLDRNGDGWLDDRDRP